MAKKASSKKKKGVARVVHHSANEIKTERAIIENFIGLQRVMVNLSAKFDSLSSQISRLLDLFEISAKALAKKEISSSGDLEAKKILEKLENLSQQAGLIGKGLALIHEVRSENLRPIDFNPQRNKVQLPSPVISSPMHSNSFVIEPSPQKMTRELGGFEKSIATKGQKLRENANAGTNI